MLSALEIARREASDELVGILEEVTDSSPEMDVIPGDVRKGSSYKITSRTGLPGSSFASAGGGWTPAFSTYAEKLVQYYNFGTVLQVPKSIAKRDDKGVDQVLMDEASGAVTKAFLNLGSQIPYGTTQDTKGFPGLNEMFTAFNNGIEVDAGGTTAGTGSTVWMINTRQQGVRLVFGEGSALTMDPWREQQITDPNDSTKQIPAYVSALQAWIGMQVGHPKCIGRIRDLTEDSGKGLTWQRMSKLWSKFPVGMKPNLILMSRRSEDQLAENTTIVANAMATQGSNPAAIPVVGEPITSWRGARIVVTDSITDTETLT